MRRVYGPLEGAKGEGANGDQGTGEEEEEEDHAIDVDFGMVDGREQEGIARWVKRHRHLFGQKEFETRNAVRADETAPKPSVDNEDSDEDDSDFAVDSSSDGGSTTDDSDNDRDDQSEEEGEETSASEGAGEAEEANVEDDGEEELKPEHHPLLRPGAMPRMSRAAIEAVVGMVEADMLGKSEQGGGDSEDELDELDE